MKKSSLEIPLAQLQKSPTNPRQSFPATEIDQLAASMADLETGQLQALIVRPVWCQGCASQAQIEKRREHAGTAAVELYEVVDGARRHLAAPKAGFTALRCEERLMTDSAVISVQLITFLQKKGLTPREEAHGFQDLLKLKGENGQPMHTAESIAKTVGMEGRYVYQRLKLLALPEMAANALDDGRIGVVLASRIARVPGKEDRLKAAQAIIAPARVGGEPMSLREAEIFLKENFMRELKGAPFDTANEALPGPEGKPMSCAKCPLRTGNNKELFGDVQRGDICTKPECFRKKSGAVFHEQSAALVAADAAAKVLTEEAGAQYFAAHDGVTMAFDSSHVDFREKPAESFVSNAVDRAKLEPWEELCDGQPVAKLLVPDRSGRLRVLVERNVAIAAAKANGEDIFVKGIGGRATSAAAPVTAENAAAKKREDREKKKTEAVGRALVEALRKEIEVHGDMLGATMVLLDLVVRNVGANAIWFVLQLRGVKKAVTETTEQAFIRHCEAIDSEHRPKVALALALELLLAVELRATGAKKSAGFAALVALYEPDVAAVEAATLKALSEKNKKGGAKQAPAAEPPVTLDPKRLAQWIKLRAGGKTDEQIAKLDKVPVADVTGALGAEGMRAPSGKQKSPSGKRAAGGKRK